MTRRPLARRPRRGFTIVEVLVSVVLLAIGVLGLAGVSVMSLRQVASAEQHNKALLVSQSRLERLRSLSCAQIDAQLPHSGVESGITYNFAALGSGSGGTRRIRGSYSYTPPRYPTRSFADTTTIICP